MPLVITEIIMIFRWVIPSLFNHGNYQYHSQGSTAAQPEEHQRRDSPQHPDRDHGAERLGQVVAGLRHDLRRGAAPLRGNAVGICPAVPRPDGAARCGQHRRAEPGDLHRTEDDQPQSTVDGRNHHGNLRLPAAALQLDWAAALPELRTRDLAPVGGADRAAGDGPEAGRPGDDSGADGARTKGRIQERAGQAGAAGVCPRPHRWRAAPHCRRGDQARQAQEPHH